MLRSDIELNIFKFRIFKAGHYLYSDENVKYLLLHLDSCQPLLLSRMEKIEPEYQRQKCCNEAI